MKKNINNVITINLEESKVFDLSIYKDETESFKKIPYIERDYQS